MQPVLCRAPRAVRAADRRDLGREVRLPRVRTRLGPDLTSHPCGRYANLAELSEEDRENKLEVGNPSTRCHPLCAGIA